MEENISHDEKEIQFLCDQLEKWAHNLKEYLIERLDDFIYIRHNEYRADYKLRIGNQVFYVSIWIASGQVFTTFAEAVGHNSLYWIRINLDDFPYTEEEREKLWKKAMADIEKENKKYQLLEEYFPDMLRGISAIIRKAILSDVIASTSDIEMLKKAKEITELKIIENWKNQEKQNLKTLCSIYFDISLLLPLECETDENFYDVFKMIVFGYLGEDYARLKDFLIERQRLFSYIDNEEEWNKRLFKRCFQAIVSLVTRHSQKDIETAINSINQLRQEQRQYGDMFLEEVMKDSRSYEAAELVSLYYFARAVELLGQYLLEGREVSPNYSENYYENKLKYYIRVAKEFANASGNMLLVLLYQYFLAFGIRFLQKNDYY